MCWWLHEKGKCLTTIDLGISNVVYDISINPVDANTVSIIGKNYFACYIKLESS